MDFYWPCVLLDAESDSYEEGRADRVESNDEMIHQPMGKFEKACFADVWKVNDYFDGHSKLDLRNCLWLAGNDSPYMGEDIGRFHKAGRGWSLYCRSPSCLIS